VIVADNLSSHKVQGIRERIEAADAEVLYLPPYSRPISTPSKKPVPNSNSTLMAKARTAEQLQQVIADALKTITSRDATSWFRTPHYAL